jgi:hypothetical protein
MIKNHAKSQFLYTCQERHHEQGSPVHASWKKEREARLITVLELKRGHFSPCPPIEPSPQHAQLLVLFSKAQVGSCDTFDLPYQFPIRQPFSDSFDRFSRLLDFLLVPEVLPLGSIETRPTRVRGPLPTKCLIAMEEFRWSVAVEQPQLFNDEVVRTFL